ncbi:MAG: polysaccharide biosynthesis protein, partial [Okeania sp. SIO2G5]|nr:polysaccharide biosynthesis protein [Okeania sp. SIO2G5]
MLEKRKILGNSAAIFVNRLIQSLTAYALTAVIARLKGATELGQYLLAFSYFFIFMTIVSQGLRVSLIR